MKYCLKIANTLYSRHIFALLVLLILPGCSTKDAPQFTPIVQPESTMTADAIQAQTQIAYGFTPTPLPSSTPWPIATSTSSPISMDYETMSISPLTGLTVTDLTTLKQRPVLIKLSNWPQYSRPLTGINQADLVFEYFIGYQMNDFVAVYGNSDCESIGPIAPARIIDARLTEHYQGLIAFDSADSTAGKIFDEVLPGRAFSRGYTTCPAMCTIKTTTGEETFVNTTEIRKYAENQSKLPGTSGLEGFTFDQSFTDWDAEASQFTYLYADFSVMDWRYDIDKGKYFLWQDFQNKNGEITLKQTFDKQTGKPIAFENVLILFANYIEYNPGMYDIDFREGDPNQQALLLRDGKLIYGTWIAPTSTSPISLNTMKGNPLGLRPGRSWIILTSVHSSLKQLSLGNWEMQFSIK